MVLHDGDLCYCESCYQELLDKIAILEKEIERLDVIEAEK